MCSRFECLKAIWKEALKYHSARKFTMSRSGEFLGKVSECATIAFSNFTSTAQMFEQPVQAGKTTGSDP